MPTHEKEKTIAYEVSPKDNLQDQYFYSPSPEYQKVVNDVYDRFWDARKLREQAFAYFNNRTLLEYIEDSTKRFNSIVEERDDLKDWQARVFDPVTRDKTISLLAKAAQNRPASQFFGRFDEDKSKGRILESMVEFSKDLDDEDELIFYAMLEAATKGTIVGFEGFEKDYRENRKVYGSIVPLEEFYPTALGVRKIQDLADCFWVTEITLGEFKKLFGLLTDAEYVETGSLVLQHENPFLKDYIDSNLGDFVQIIRYYNQVDKQYVLCANGVWLNPGPDGTIQKLPWKHGKLPFWRAIFEPLAADFFYGMSFPDKLKGNQDVLNTLYNMMLDQSFLSIFKPLITNSMDEIEDQILVPGRQIAVDDPNNWGKELQISGPDSAHFNILQFVKRSMEESSSSSLEQGVAGLGGRTTATEIERASKAIEDIIGMFGRFMEWGVRDKDRLRASNVLQYYTKPILAKALGDEGLVNVFRVDGLRSKKGMKKTRLLKMFSSRDQFPSRDELKTEAKLKGVEIDVFTPEFIKDWEHDVKIVPGSGQPRMSKALERAQEIEKTKSYMTFYPDFYNREAGAIRMAESFGDDPEEIFKLGQEGNQGPLPAEFREGGGVEKPGNGMLENMGRGGSQMNAMAPKNLVR